MDGNEYLLLVYQCIMASDISAYHPINGELQKKIVDKLEFRDLYNSEGLYFHQEFVRRYLSPYTPYMGLIIVHSLGSGKSLACIATAVDHYLYDKKKCLIVTKGSSGRENFKRETEHYYEMGKFSVKKYPDDKGPKIPFRDYSRIFHLNHYMALHNTICTMTDKDVEEQFSNTIFVFDEIHNVRKLRATKTSDNEDGSHIYDSLKRVLCLARNSKVILATATPMTNDIGQLNSTIDLLGATSYNGIISYNSEIKDRPTKIFHGEDGYLAGMKVWISHMVGHQRKCHVKEQQKGTPTDIYRMLTHASLFAFPGENLYGSTIYKERIMVPVKVAKDIVSIRSRTKKKITYTTYQVIESYRKYLMGEALRQCSCKYWEMMDILERQYPTVGPIFIFVEEVKGSGLLLLANIFEAHGYELYVGQHLSTIGKGKRFTICVGDQSISPNQSDRLEGFNHRRNVSGEYVRVIIGSKVMGESITLRNVRQFHLGTIHWNDSTIEQAIARTVRSGSHNQLEESERKVDIFIHAALCDIPQKDGKMGKSGGEQGTDIYKLHICDTKQKSIAKMERKLKRYAVDRYIIQEEPNGGHVPPPDSGTFIRYYMERYVSVLMPLLEEILQKLFASSDTIPIDDILDCVDKSHTKVLMELICRTITGNVRILGGKYLREDFDGLFLIDDPSLPFFFVRDRTVKVEEVVVKSQYDIPRYKDDATVKSTIECVEQLRQMPFISRISFVEKHVRKRIGVKKDPVPRIFNALFIKYHGELHHVMCYRVPGEAYTAVLPIPKRDRLDCRTRVLRNGKWKYVESVEIEAKVVAKMEENYAQLMSTIDEQEEIFLVISLIDGKPRIRTRFLETSDKGLRDKRYVRKGRSMPSIVKPTLAMLLVHSLELFDEDSKIGNVTRRMRMRHLSHNECVKPYGYTSMAELVKSRPSTYDIFVDAMEGGSVSQLVDRIVKLMVDKRKCIFL